MQAKIVYISFPRNGDPAEGEAWQNKAYELVAQSGNLPVNISVNLGANDATFADICAGGIRYSEEVWVFGDGECETQQVEIKEAKAIDKKVYRIIIKEETKTFEKVEV